jgi:hypothetical protein
MTACQRHEGNDLAAKNFRARYRQFAGCALSKQISFGLICDRLLNVVGVVKLERP